MSNWIKQSTSVVISFGPFLDKTDGVTLETGLVSALDHGTSGIKLSKNGGALTIRHATVTATTYDALGMYRVTLDTTDTGTLGTLRIAFEEAATCLPVWQDVMVLPANVYDSLVGGSDTLDVAVTSIGANVITAASIAADAITDAKVASDVTIASVTGAVGSVAGNVGGNVVGSVGSVVGHTAQTGDAYARLGAPAGASVSADIAAVAATLGTPDFGTLALDNAENYILLGGIDAKTTNLPATPADEATLTAMKGATFAGATDSLEAIRDRGDAAWATATGFSTLDAAGVRAAVGLASANLDTQLTAIDDLVDTEVAAIYNRLGAPAGASIAADIAGITAGSGLDAAGVRAAIGMASANLDTQLGTIDDYLDTEVGAIKTKTDYLPSATAGAAGGLFIAGANAATTVDITGNITGNLSGTVGSVTGAVGSVTGAVGSVTGAVGSVAANGITATSIATDAINAASVKADAVTKIQNGLATPTNITAAAGIALSAGERTTLANAILDLADGATTNYTLREALEVMLAVLAGKLSGAATATITIRDVNDTKNVVVATTDASGNRTAVTITP